MEINQYEISRREREMLEDQRDAYRKRARDYQRRLRESVPLIALSYPTPLPDELSDRLPSLSQQELKCRRSHSRQRRRERREGRDNLLNEARRQIRQQDPLKQRHRGRTSYPRRSKRSNSSNSTSSSVFQAQISQEVDSSLSTSDNDRCLLCSKPLSVRCSRCQRCRSRRRPHSSLSSVSSSCTLARGSCGHTFHESCSLHHMNCPLCSTPWRGVVTFRRTLQSTPSSRVLNEIEGCQDDSHDSIHSIPGLWGRERVVFSGEETEPEARIRELMQQLHQAESQRQSLEERVEKSDFRIQELESERTALLSERNALRLRVDEADYDNVIFSDVSSFEEANVVLERIEELLSHYRARVEVLGETKKAVLERREGSLGSHGEEIE